MTDEDRAHYEGKQLRVDEAKGDPEKVQELRRDYYANVSCADRNMGRVLEAIDRKGQTENTLVVFMGDNGFNVGQHGLLGKGNARILESQDRHPNMFDHSVLVPFIVRWPDVVEAGTVCNKMVATIDILPTVAEATGQADQLQVDGKSLMPLFRGEDIPTWRDAWFDTYDMRYGAEDHMRMIRIDSWKLVRHSEEGKNELYNLNADPEEQQNLFDQPETAAVQAKLGARLEQWMEETGGVE